MTSIVSREELFDNYTIIQRKPFAEFLTPFLNNQAEYGYVLNLSGEWGAGKTTFLQCWYNELKKTHPVIYFDAWKSDFTHDAMTALLDCFHDQLANPISQNKELMGELFAKGGFFIKKAIPSLLVGYLKHKTGTEGESLLGDITENLGIDIDESNAGDALKDVLKSVLEQRQKVEGIKEFKKVLEKLAKAYIESQNGTKNYPIYVLIDELDRCRPDYAIEVIESVKHFFNTKNFVFVLATDSEQLQHSVKAIYGQGFDANLYLSRFFDQVVHLPQPDLAPFIKARLIESVDDDFELNNEFMGLVTKIFEYHRIQSLREIHKVLLVVKFSRAIKQHSFCVLSLILLSLLKRHFPAQYTNLTKEGNRLYKGRSSSPDPKENLLVNFNSTIEKFDYKGSKFDFQYMLHEIVVHTMLGRGHQTEESLSQIQKQESIARQISKIVSTINYRYRINPGSGLATMSEYTHLIEYSCLFFQDE